MQQAIRGRAIFPSDACKVISLMDLNLTPQETEFRDEVRDWLRANVPAGWKAQQDAEESMAKRYEFLRNWQRKLFAAGWAGVAWPKEYGGRGASVMEQV